MRAGGGKQKGASFEREMCVRLSKWVTDGEREDVFWRSAMSGGRATVGNKRGKQHSSQVGDVSCIHPAGHKFSSIFAIECKFYANLDYQGLITGKGKFLEFWKEINNQGDIHAKYPFLIAKQNRTIVTISMSHSATTKLGLQEHQTLLISRPYDLYIFDADRFFSVCKPFV